MVYMSMFIMIERFSTNSKMILEFSYIGCFGRKSTFLSLKGKISHVHCIDRTFFCEFKNGFRFFISRLFQAKIFFFYSLTLICESWKKNPKTGNIRECHFWKKNPIKIKKIGFWEHQGASFLEKKSRLFS